MLLLAEDLGHRKRKWLSRRPRGRCPLSCAVIIIVYYVPTRIIILYLCAYNIVFLGSPPGADDKAVCSTPSGHPAPERLTHTTLYYTVYRSAGI